MGRGRPPKENREKNDNWNPKGKWSLEVCKEWEAFHQWADAGSYRCYPEKIRAIFADFTRLEDLNGRIIQLNSAISNLSEENPKKEQRINAIRKYKEFCEERAIEKIMQGWSSEVAAEWFSFSQWAKKYGFVHQCRMACIHFEYVYKALSGKNLDDIDLISYYDNILKALSVDDTSGIQAYLIYLFCGRYGMVSKSAIDAIIELYAQGTLCATNIAKELTGKCLNIGRLCDVQKSEILEKEAIYQKTNSVSLYLFNFLWHRVQCVYNWRREPENKVEGYFLKDEACVDRNFFSEAGKKLHNKLCTGNKLQGSRVEQLLLQIGSLQSPHADAIEHDWFADFSTNELNKYMAVLCFELYIALVLWDGESFPPPQITGEYLLADGLPIMVAMPFIKILPNEKMVEFFRGAPETVQSYRTTAMVELLKSGVVWVSPKRIVSKHSLSKMPLTIRNVSNWNMLDIYEDIWSNENCRNFLRDLLNLTFITGLEVARKGKDVTTTKDDLSWLEELQSLLLAAKKSGNYNNFVPAIIEVIAINCIEYIQFGTLNQAEKTATALFSLYQKHIKCVNLVWQKYLAKPGRPREIDDTHFIIEVFTAFQKRIKRDVEQQSIQNEDSITDYYFYAQRAFAQVFHIAQKMADPKLAEASITIFVNTMTTHTELWKNLPEASIDAVLYDFIQPCKKAFDEYSAYFGKLTQREVTQEYNKALQIVLARFHEAKKEDLEYCNKQFSLGVPKLNTQYNQSISNWAAVRLSNQAEKLSMSVNQERFSYWLLDDFDSVTLTSTHGNIANAEAKLQKTLMEARNVVLTLPMLVDSQLMRNLAHSSDFLWALRMGLVNVSSYGNTLNLYDDLLSYAAHQLDSTGFKWSSLSQNLNNSEKARKQAALFLQGKDRAPEDFRLELESFRDALRLLDENIPYKSRVRFYQIGAIPEWQKEVADVCEKDPTKRGIYRAVIENLIQSSGVTIDKYTRSDFLNELDRSFTGYNGVEAVRTCLNAIYIDMLRKRCRLGNASLPSKNDLSEEIGEFAIDTEVTLQVIAERTTETVKPGIRTYDWQDIRYYRAEFAKVLAKEPENTDFQMLANKIGPEIRYAEDQAEKAKFSRIQMIPVRTHSGQTLTIEIGVKPECIYHTETSAVKEGKK